MKKIVVASDSFKGTLSSKRICELFKQVLKDRKDINLVCLPIADGGEGSLDAISYVLKGKFVDVAVNDLYSNKIKSHFFVDEKENVYIEAASCIGMNLSHKNNNPGLVTTFGVGEMIKAAIEMGCKKIFVFLGGSATNDGGVGLASALGTIFYDQDNKPFLPTGLTLKNITRIDNEKTTKLLKNTAICGLIDVNSPFFGVEGAAYKFAKQKGATDEEITKLDDGLKHLSKIIEHDLNTDMSNVPGSGAAGGLGGGLVAFANAQLISGIDTILECVDFDNAIKDADLVISGEGKLDTQTFDGKVIDGVAKKCEKLNKKLDLIVGISDISFDFIKTKYRCINNILETNPKHLSLVTIRSKVESDYLMAIKYLLEKNGFY